MSSEEKILNKIWIKKNFFDSNKLFLSTINKTIDDLNPAYDIWKAANETIEEFGDDIEKRNQGFLSLKRAFNVTSKALDKNLGLNNINYQESLSKKKILERLEYFEITKTKTINKYLTIRNMIEHRNLKPPSKEDCLSLSEYIWNYIRNVSNIFANIVIECIFRKENFRYEDDIRMINFVYDVEEKTFIPHLYVYAILKKEDISFVAISDAIVVENISLLSKKDDNIKLYINEEDSMEFNYIIFKSEILNHELVAKYIKYMTLPEYGGINEYTIRDIF